MSAFAHMIVLLNKERYITDLSKGINYFRWYEYSISSSLMIGIKFLISFNRNAFWNV